MQIMEVKVIYSLKSYKITHSFLTLQPTQKVYKLITATNLKLQQNSEHRINSNSVMDAKERATKHGEIGKYVVHLYEHCEPESHF